ncbi:nucleoside phosphorylase-I family protein [Aeoliella mucimassa]|uniref:Uncharacterized protein n=1 Tax=Aeoliella mucimassa TaxID=2527972 RepID=A0A518AMQ9_9BACT|nr:hypothetical protein [Aeoliella mucimassa]QDU55993.1 hypothetical protein Pan181_21950 [Aeoliella mucimassa]
MGWLWQVGARMLGSRMVSEAKQAATSEVAKAMLKSGPSDPAAAIAVLCENKWLFDAVVDELVDKRRLEADRMQIAQGQLAEVPVVVARPLGEAVEPLRMVTAVVDAHLPKFAMSVAEGICLDRELKHGTLVMATRLIDSAGRSLRVELTPPTGEGLRGGTVGTIGAPVVGELAATEQLPVVEDAWSSAVARACQRVGLPLVAVSAVVQLPLSERSQAAEAMHRQRSMAGRAGVLTGMLFKKRSGLKHLWNDKQAKWDATVRIAGLAKYLAKSVEVPKSNE